MDQLEHPSTLQNQAVGGEPAAPFPFSDSDTAMPAGSGAEPEQANAAGRAFSPGISILPSFPAQPVFPLPDNTIPIPGGPGPVIRPVILPMPNTPCINCNNNQWIHGGIRILNAAAGYNPFMIAIDNQTVFSSLDFAAITQYRQTSQGYHTFTIMASNGYVYLQKSMYVGDGMATIAIVNAPNGIDLVDIADNACPAGNGFACFRVCNLAYYSGSVNVSLGNLLFNIVNFRQVTGFSRVRNGNYPLSVSRSSRPGMTLLTTTVSLAPNRIYTLYVLNWNPSVDSVRTLLVEDRRS